MTVRTPMAKSRPLVRMKSASLLAAGAAVVNGTAVYAIVPVLGAVSLSVRIKTSGAGALDIVFVGPDFDSDQAVAFGSLAGTLYTSGNPTQVAITGGTEAIITATCHGENYAIVKFTPSANGTITYCDVGNVPASL